MNLIVRKLEYMQAELESNSLQVCLAPSKRRLNEHDQIRVALSRNANWYRTMCARFQSGRKKSRTNFDTLIKRRETLKALNRLIEGRALGTVYEARILAIAKGIKI
jgi:hypothetical protein